MRFKLVITRATAEFVYEGHSLILLMEDCARRARYGDNIGVFVLGVGGRAGTWLELDFGTWRKQ